MSEHIDFADSVWGEFEPRLMDSAPILFHQAQAHWHLLQAVKELKEEVESLAETVDILVSVVLDQHNRINDLKSRLQSTLEVNDLWDGS